MKWFIAGIIAYYVMGIIAVPVMFLLGLLAGLTNTTK